jgi:hypothetical protein
MKIRSKFAFNTVAAILAFVIGAMAVFAGGRVLLGILPDYYVIDWLPTYNFVMGLVAVFFAYFVIWKHSRYSIPVAAATFGVHAIVMLVLQTAYRQVVAIDSIVAMTVRLVFWTIILGLLIVQRRYKKILQQHEPII